MIFNYSIKRLRELRKQGCEEEEEGTLRVGKQTYQTDGVHHVKVETSEGVNKFKYSLLTAHLFKEQGSELKEVDLEGTDFIYSWNKYDSLGGEVKGWHGTGRKLGKHLVISKAESLDGVTYNVEVYTEEQYTSLAPVPLPLPFIL